MLYEVITAVSFWFLLGQFLIFEPIKIGVVIWLLLVRADIHANVITSYSIHYTKLYETNKILEGHWIYIIVEVKYMRSSFYRQRHENQNRNCQHNQPRPISDEIRNRITSYNVCYTKLLRRNSHQHSGHTTDYKWSQESKCPIRITSYNVCYTKLLRTWSLLKTGWKSQRWKTV